ncbi:hypothetical protein DFH06DRAFT_1220366 [Mycena polygramma]|nr:hypothetical protein DFH06DRAFT_1220366 [Mycena polygramma]
MVLLCSKCGGSSTVAATLLAIEVPPAPPGASSPDLVRLLTSNEVPLDAEIRAVGTIVADGQQQADALNAQITDLQTILTRLVRKRDETVERVLRHSAILAPVRRVPMELLCEIFALTLLGDDTAGRPPWYLAHICRSWRFSALAYPSLWTSITIPNSRHSMLPMIETQLLRSADAPLTVHWWRDSSDPMDPHSRDAVLAACNRWATLHLSVEGTTTDLQWLRPVAGRLTALRKFDLSSPATLEIPQIFSGASSLREIYVSGLTFRDHSPNIVIPWGQITHFRGVYHTETLCRIFAGASDLLECTVSFYDELEPRTPIAVPCLRRLCADGSRCLLHLTAPLLEELFLNYTFSPDELLRFVHRSSCLLKTLVLMKCTISSDFIAVLRDLPSLTYLLIEEDDDNDATDVSDLFEAMTITRTSRDMCPNLTSMVLGPTSNFSSDIFFIMVKSRLHPSHSCSPLERLRLFCPPFSRTRTDWPKLNIQVQQLRDEGFDVATLDDEEVGELETRPFVFDTI